MLKPLMVWQSDSNTNECNKCKKVFGYFIRKHHCRNCGYIFCYECTAKKIEIPEFIKKPLPKTTIYSSWISESTDKRVCDACFRIISLYRQNKIIEVFNIICFDIKTIKILAQVCSEWNKYAIYYKKIFRDLQYELRELNNLEKKILKKNIAFLQGHDIWMRQLIKYQISTSFTFKRGSLCKNILCSRNCNKFINETMLLLCDSSILDPELHSFALNKLDNYEPHITYLLDQGMKSPFTIILDWVISKCDNLRISNEVFWFMRCSVDSLKLKSLRMKWEKTAHCSRILEGLKFVEILENNKINKLPELLKQRNIILPTHIELDNLEFVDIIYKKSASSPVILIFSSGEKEISNPNSYGSSPEIKIKKARKYIKVLYKPDDVRQDQVIMSIISAVENILTDEIWDMLIVKYKVLPISPRAGLIEVIEGETLYNVYKRGSLINYILRNNPTTTASEICDRFVYSTAAYCAITYLLGVGDRHLDNIMITPNGLLFHIDYGFILGSDPKYIDEIRVSEDIITALGDNYDFFKELCADKIYNTLRRHIPIIFNLLTTLTNYGTSLEQIKKTIFKKFIPGASRHHAKLCLYTNINRSSSKYKIVDILHSSQQDGLIKKINSSAKYLKSFFF